MNPDTMRMLGNQQLDGWVRDAETARRLGLGKKRRRNKIAADQSAPLSLVSPSESPEKPESECEHHEGAS